MKVNACGKAHLEGTSKRTGKPCNFNQVHHLSPARGMDGLAAQTLTLDPGLHPLDSIAVNGEYNVEFDNRGYGTADTKTNVRVLMDFWCLECFTRRTAAVFICAASADSPGPGQCPR